MEFEQQVNGQGYSRVLPVVEGVREGQDDADHGDQRPDLDHGPCGPVERHEVLAVAELEC